MIDSTKQKTDEPVFTPITILGIDIDGSKESDSPGLYDVLYQLSEFPPAKWRDLFNNPFPPRFRHKHRRAKVVGKNIICTCELDDARSIHLKELEDEVNSVNLQYEEFLASEKVRIDAARKAKEDEEKKKRDALGGDKPK
jgi:hypothetical protein